jgi:hypothetical protein
MLSNIYDWRRVMRVVRVLLAGAILTGVALIPTVVGAAPSVDCATAAAVNDATYRVASPDGTVTVVKELGTFETGTVRAGDVVVGTFTLNPACASVVISGASYWAPSPIFSDANQRQQVLFDSTTKTVTTGGIATTISLTLRIPLSGIAFGTCPNKHNALPMTFNGNGGTAASGNQYASTCDGRPSLNGNGNGNAAGKPCQGCVGNADNKNPKGQAPNGSDHNNGYECDGNNGVGKGNPAHSSCITAHFQMEFVVGPVIAKFVDANGASVGYKDNVKIAGGSTLG